MDKPGSIYMRTVESVTITTIVDNDVWRRGLASSWGLSFHIEVLVKEGRKFRVLMDVGGSFQAFKKNCSVLGIDPTRVESIFISHWHGDHCGALRQVLSLAEHSVPVYVPVENSSGIRKIEAVRGKPVICAKPTTILDGLMSTGKMPEGISEHSLIINVESKGLVVLTGCSHPGIVNILKAAREVSGVNNIYAVMGGFHISGVTAGVTVGEFLKELKVEVAGPCHCTGQNAKDGIARVIGEGCIKMGSGRVMTIGKVFLIRPG